MMNAGHCEQKAQQEVGREEQIGDESAMGGEGEKTKLWGEYLHRGIQNLAEESRTAVGGRVDE